MKCEFFRKHSLNLKNINCKTVISLLALLMLGLTLAPHSHAQMFSVGEPRARFNIPQTEFYVGIEPMDVSYQGGDDITAAEGARAFNFKGSILRLGYESRGLDLFLGSGGSITGIDEASYFDVGGNIDLGLQLYRSKAFNIAIPIRIASRYTNMTSDRNFQVPSVNRFRFGSLTVGAGARVRGRLQDNFRFETGAVPSYGFAFASGGFFGGSLGSVAAFGRLYFDRLFGNSGLSIGYKYDLRNYNVDENVYDYKILGHSIELGITF